MLQEENQKDKREQHDGNEESLKDVVLVPLTPFEKSTDKLPTTPPQNLQIPISIPFQDQIQKQAPKTESPKPKENIIPSFKELFLIGIKNNPIKAKNSLDKELETYDMKLIKIQSEQQNLLVKMTDLQKELEKQKQEISDLSLKLAELIKGENYSQADYIQQSINMASDKVRYINLIYI